jgi:hypothetical protein
VSDRLDRVAGHPLGATIAGLVLFSAGLLIGVGAIEADRKERERRGGTLETEGTVVAQIRQPSGSAVVFAPLVAFSTASGERVTFTARDVDSTADGIGAKIPVIYHVGNPADARVDRKARRRMGNTIAASAALLLIVFGAYVAWYARRWQAVHAAQTGGA